MAVVVLLIAPSAAAPSPVAATDASYQACGRIFSDPQAFWPSPGQAPGRSPWAKGSAACAATDFVTYGEMTSGLEYLETLFPQFVEFYNLEKDFGTGADCATSTSSQHFCSAGLPRQGVPASRVKSDLFMVRLTDERVSNTNKRYFVFPLSIHGIERAGAEAGVRIAEDLATWGYCEAVARGEIAPKPVVNCAKEGAIPHPLLETTPSASVTAGNALRQSAIYLIFPNPDGWRRGDPDNLTRFYQRYNGNGVDLNRDWPTIGYTFRPYTPWSEPEGRSFGHVLKGIKGTWDGGIDLHGQLIDRAFSFTLLGASERDYAKNQRILQTVKGAWADAERRLSWSPLIKPNDAPQDDERLYGVQWGTVWDTINYTTTGSLGDWIDSPLGLGADGIDNEMSLSHLSNCGTGTCYLPDAEQLHVDGNKSLVYSDVNFTLLPEETSFNVPGNVAYVFDPTVLSNPGSGGTQPPTAGLSPQPAIMDVRLDPTNSFRHEFEIKGADQGFYNGGVEAKATPVNVGGISGQSLTSLVIEQYRASEENPQEDAGCGAVGDNWSEVNRYYNQASTYAQSGQAVHANSPAAGRWRVCVTGALATQIAANGGFVDLDITFSQESAWEDPGQKAYSVTNMKFFSDLATQMAPGQLVPVGVDAVLNGTANLDQYTSVVVADDAFPGYVEPLRTGPAQPGQTFDAAAKTAATIPCAYQPGTQDNLPPTCAADFEFDVDPSFNNQQMTITFTAGDLSVDYDLYIERQSRVGGWWSPVGDSASGSATESTTLLRPPAGHYRARVVNWAGGGPGQTLEIAFSNEYVGPPIGTSQRTTAERDAWGAQLHNYVEQGGNLVLTDGAVRNLAYASLLGRQFINDFSAYAGYIAFTRDGNSATYDDPLAHNVNQPGAAEGPQHRHQTYEPVPIGFAIQDAAGADFNASPIWGVDQTEWERLGGRTVGTTTADQVTLGELAVGAGTVRVIGAAVPMPSEEYYHPFGLANYAVTYTGYQVLQNALQWNRPPADLAVTVTDSPDPVRSGSSLTYTIRVTNNGPSAATGVTLSDTLPKNAGWSSTTTTQGTCSAKPVKQVVTCNLGSLASGAVATVTIVVKPTTKGTITNKATVSGSPADPSTANNTATATTTVR